MEPPEAPPSGTSTTRTSIDASPLLPRPTVGSMPPPLRPRTRSPEEQRPAGRAPSISSFTSARAGSMSGSRPSISVATAPRNNRQSVSFPISVNVPSLPEHRNRPPASVISSTASSPRHAIFPSSHPPHTYQTYQTPVLISASAFAADTAELLGQLAARERRVMELREELQKAERDLEATKKRWILHEANRKRNEVRSSQKMTPLASRTVEVRSARAARSPSTEENMDTWGTDERPHSALTKLELLAESPKSKTFPTASDESHGSGHSARQSVSGVGNTSAGSHVRGRILSGQRHIRPLSLVGPDLYEPGDLSTTISPDHQVIRSPMSDGGVVSPSAGSKYNSSFTRNLLAHPSNSYVPPTPIRNGMAKAGRSSTSKSRSRSPNHKRNGLGSLRPMSVIGEPGGDEEELGAGGNLARTGKRIAKDFQDGLWTFLGDLKQATISTDPVVAVAGRGSPARAEAKGGGTAHHDHHHHHLASSVS